MSVYEAIEDAKEQTTDIESKLKSIYISVIRIH